MQLAIVGKSAKYFLVNQNRCACSKNALMFLSKQYSCHSHPFQAFFLCLCRRLERVFVKWKFCQGETSRSETQMILVSCLSVDLSDRLFSYICRRPSLNTSHSTLRYSVPQFCKHLNVVSNIQVIDYNTHKELIIKSQP